MKDQPTDSPAQEISSKPVRKTIEQELLGFAVDANELIGRIHSGQPGDLNSIIQSAIDDRPCEALDKLSCEMPEPMNNAA